MISLRDNSMFQRKFIVNRGRRDPFSSDEIGSFERKSWVGKDPLCLSQTPVVDTKSTSLEVF